MSRYIICDNCKELIEYRPDIKYEGGTSYSILKCPLCGHTKETNKSHVHYGLDGKK